MSKQYLQALASLLEGTRHTESASATKPTYRPYAVAKRNWAKKRANAKSMQRPKRRINAKKTGTRKAKLQRCRAGNGTRIRARWRSDANDGTHGRVYERSCTGSTSHCTLRPTLSAGRRAYLYRLDCWRYGSPPDGMIKGSTAHVIACHER